LPYVEVWKFSDHHEEKKKTLSPLRLLRKSDHREKGEGRLEEWKHILVSERSKWTLSRGGGSFWLMDMRRGINTVGKSFEKNAVCLRKRKRLSQKESHGEV